MLKEFNLDIGCAHRRNKMVNEYYQEEYEKVFCKPFNQMANKVENCFHILSREVRKEENKEGENIE